MERRSFFGILFSGLLARFLPKPKIDPTRVDMLDMSKWDSGIVNVSTRGIRIPMQLAPLNQNKLRLAFGLERAPLTFTWGMNADQREAVRKKYEEGVDVQAAIDAL